MKLIHALALGVLSFSSAMPSARAETVAIDKVVFDPEIWKSSLDEVKKTVDGTRKKPKSEPLPEEIRKQLKEKGAGHFASGWVWLAAQDGSSASRKPTMAIPWPMAGPIRCW